MLCRCWPTLLSIRLARNQIFNIGAETPYTVNELAKHVAKAMGVSPNVKYLDARNELKHAFSNHKRVEGVFGYKPKFTLEAGLAKWPIGPGGSGPGKANFLARSRLPKTCRSVGNNHYRGHGRR